MVFDTAGLEEKNTTVHTKSAFSLSPQLGFQAGRRQDDRRSEPHVALPIKVPHVPGSKGQTTKQEES